MVQFPYIKDANDNGFILTAKDKPYCRKVSKPFYEFEIKLKMIIYALRKHYSEITVAWVL